MLDPVREAFSREYLKHGNASEAFRTANPKSKKWKSEAVHVEACKMLKEPKVELRLQQLQEASAKKHDITIDRLTEMTLAAYELAMRDGVKAPSAAVKASEFLGKLHGLIVDKKEVTGKDGAPLVPVAHVTIARTKP